MKLQQYVFLSILLQVTATMHASDLITQITSATTSLNGAQAALASLLGVTAPQGSSSDTSSTSTDNNSNSATTDTTSTTSSGTSNNTDTSSTSSTNTNNSTDTSSTGTGSTNTGDTSSNSNDNTNTTTDTSSTSSSDTNNSTDTSTSTGTNTGDNSSTSTPTPPDTTPVDNNPIVPTPVNTPAAPAVITTTITNNTNQIVYLVMLDQNSQQINPANIALAIGAFSYIPSNVATVKIVDSKNLQLVAATPIAQNTLYALTNVKNAWKLAATAAPTAYNYTNATTIPLIITITAGNAVYNQQLAPGEVYAQVMDPSTNVIVDAHANLAAIITSYNPALSYDLTINAHNELSLTSTSATDKTLTNRTGWPILITTITSSNVEDDMNLDDNEYFVPANTTTTVMITPLILNQTSSSALVKSCSITTKNGQLVLQF